MKNISIRDPKEKHINEMMIYEMKILKDLFILH